MSNEIKELSVSTSPSLKIISQPLLCLDLMRRYMSHLPLHVVLTNEGESPASQYLRLGRGTLDPLSPVSSS